MSTEAVQQATQLMDRHIVALNNRDAEAVAATLHFPHHRLSGNSWKTWENADHYLSDFLARAGSNWKRSAFNDIKVLGASEKKVHLDTEVLRFDSDDTLISQFRSLWVIIELDGIWAAKVRSSFAVA